MSTALIHVLEQDDHKISANELANRYGTDLETVRLLTIPASYLKKYN